MTSRYAQALEQQRRFARWLASPDGVRAFYEMGTDQVLLRRFYQAARLTLAAADPYHWVPEMCGLLEGVAAGMPAWTLRREAVPTDHGFCWFEQPLAVSDRDVLGVHRPLRVVALTWGLYGESGEPDRLVIGVYGGHPATSTIYPLWNHSWRLGTRIAAEDVYPDEEDTAANRRLGRRVFRYTAAIFALMEQKILVASPERVDRAAARRLKKAGARRPPAILVVRLRHAAREGDDHEGRPRAWTCRWIVRGHWRQQYYPASGEYRPLFILPYIKGPQEMPLRAPAERVFAVVR
jgi:hypothetical protein